MANVYTGAKNENGDGTPARRGPSRKECEDAIRRILITETFESGGNRHFRTSTDFMPYFEALYPAGPSLKKQVQRALKALDMPKDRDGFLLVNKTKEQMDEDRLLSSLLQDAGALVETDEADTVLSPIFLRLAAGNPGTIACAAEKLTASTTLAGKFTACIPCTNGILFLTKQPGLLRSLLTSLVNLG